MESERIPTTTQASDGGEYNSEFVKHDGAGAGAGAVLRERRGGRAAREREREWGRAVSPQARSCPHSSGSGHRPARGPRGDVKQSEQPAVSARRI